jgi:hypothetical protein
VRCDEAVLWIDRTEIGQLQPKKVIAYIEGNVELSNRGQGGQRLTDKTWFGRFFTSADVDVRVPTLAGKPDVLPPIYWRGMERRTPESEPVRQVQFTSSAPAASPGPTPVPGAPPVFPESRPGAIRTVVPPAGMGGPATVVTEGRRVRVFPRSDLPVQAQWFPDPTGQRWIAVIDSGVNVIIDVNTNVPGTGWVSTIDVSADRLVLWTTGTQEPDLSGRTVQDQRVPLELYMEGNIVFRQGERIVYADRMYYDVPNHLGTILNVDMLTPVRTYAGLLRLHADVVQQTAPDRYLAENAFLTSSRMGSPTYRLQSNNLYFQDIQRPLLDPNTGQPVLDPATCQPAVEHERLATASNDFLFLGPVPIFYWPTLSTDLNNPTYYIRQVQLKQDNVLGTQFLTKWDAYQLLGIRDKPVGADFSVDLDYLSKRGLGHGGNFSYDREGMFDIPGHVTGFIDYWGIQDQGVDNLGEFRSAVPPEANYRYRLYGQHRELLPYDLQLTAELGWISDRNFVEEYHKSEWEELKDEITGIELKRLTGNSSWSITADYRINDFFTETNWLPRGDHYWLGQSLFGVLTWYEHSSAAYAQFHRTNVPENIITVGNPAGPAGPFNYLPWEHDAQGGRFATRQELDYPFQLGMVKVVPYALGEAAHWGEDIFGNPMDRLFWQGGVRADLPMWSVDPTINSELWNVHGIAHKVDCQLEFAYAKANQNFENLPLYDPLDDWSVEAFRRRYLTTTFGIPSGQILTTPFGTPWPGTAKFDERLYALRTGLQNWVASPSTEIAGDLETLRLGVDQRWQTKRGPPDCRHIIDWITLDTNVTLFPDPSRDNFGQTVGLLDYDFNWHVGDRLTLVSEGIFDFFSEGQKIVSIGGFLTRPPRGSLYMGFQVLEGPIDSKILSVAYTYKMSPKWLSTFSTTIDLASQGNLGESFTITRVGESFLVGLGFSFDASRNVTGVGLTIEPRFLPKTHLGNIGGAQIPPAGALGLE